MNALREAFNPLLALAQNNALGHDIVRNAVREIVGSYHHPFDIFLESVQNAVDACEIQWLREGATYAPQVEVVVDLDNNLIEVSDNGTGLGSGALKDYYFTPFSSQKPHGTEREVAAARGNKGVGATFLSYSSRRIEVYSVDSLTSEESAAALADAVGWLNSQEAALAPEVTPIPPDERCGALRPHGTTTRITIDPEQARVGRLRDHGTTLHQWEALLRLYTAVGLIDLEESSDFLDRLQVRLRVRLDGRESNCLVERGFLFPHVVTASSVRVSQLVYGDDPRRELDVRQRDKNVLYEIYPAEKVSEIINNVVQLPYYRDAKRRAMRRILADHKPRAYAAFVYSAEFWEQQNNRIWGEHAEQHLTHGYLYATKHQRIGEQNRLTLTTRTGDFNRFFLVLELDELSADIGRKSLGEEFEQFANDLLRGIRADLYRNRAALRPSPNAFAEEDEATLEQVADAAFGRPDIGIDRLHLTKIPDSEQDVVALFFDLLGLDILRGYKIYATHTAQKYDGVGTFELVAVEPNFYYSERNRLGIPQEKFADGFRRAPLRSFLEFKLSSDGLIRDLEAGAKRLSDIKWLVCWEIGTRHIEYGAGITEILEPAHVNQREYYGVTHILTEGADKVHVICLHTILDYIRGG